MNAINWLYLSDCFGVLVIAFITALGGGTLRDLLLGIHPISWIGNPTYLFLVTCAVIATMLGGRISHRFDERLFIISDAFGLAVFTIIGVQVALQQAYITAPVAIIMGILTGAGGGAIRDIICNDIPSILKREIYATASASGGISYCLLNYLGVNTLTNTLISILCVLSIRLIAVRSAWALPSFHIAP